MLPTLDYIAPKRKKAKYFSKLEASNVLSDTFVSSLRSSLQLSATVLREFLLE